jgi:hypothetical protein
MDLFGRLEYFFKRLEKYIEIRPTAAMTDIIVKIMVEVLSILGIVTKEVGQGRTSMSVLIDIPPKLTVMQRHISRSWLEGRMSRTRFSD